MLPVPDSVVFIELLLFGEEGQNEFLHFFLAEIGAALQSRSHPLTDSFSLKLKFMMFSIWSFWQAKKVQIKMM